MRQESEPPLNIEPSLQPVFRHRSGWAFALEALAPLHHPDGVLFDSFVERTFSWHESQELAWGRIPYREPWFGVIHNPPEIPAWHQIRNAPRELLDRRSFRDSLPYCLGLFTLSDHLRRWLEDRVSVPVESLVHPTEIPAVRFSADAFLANPRPMVVHVGWWLRRFDSIFRLRPGRYRKSRLAVDPRMADGVMRCDPEMTPLTAAERESVDALPFHSDLEYDRLLSRNVIFCDLIASSANNLIIECITRDTPLLVNRLPAVEEYLGRDYPLYFASLEEAAEKLADDDVVLGAHDYLRALPKEQFSQSAFRRDLSASRPYRDLLGVPPSPSPSSAGEACRTPAVPVDEPPEVFLTLSRSASGTVHVAGVDCRCADPAPAQVLQKAAGGLPLAAVRRLRTADFSRLAGPAGPAAAQSAYNALQRALARL